MRFTLYHSPDGVRWYPLDATDSLDVANSVAWATADAGNDVQICCGDECRANLRMVYSQIEAGVLLD